MLTKRSLGATLVKNRSDRIAGNVVEISTRLTSVCKSIALLFNYRSLVPSDGEKLSNFTPLTRHADVAPGHFRKYTLQYSISGPPVK